MSSHDRGSISLCTIVKNEERFIGQCLQSLQGAVDEMVIVDTGSSDSTVEIAKGFGARVYHHPWQESFSEARNYALQFAGCEWILHLDADEELERRDITLLREVVKSDLYNAVFVPIINYMPDGNVSKFYYRRLFRRGKGHYQGIVHNQIVVEGEYSTAEIRIYHHGYNLPPDEMAVKFARSEKLLKKQIKSDPTDYFARFNLARIYRNLGNYSEAIAEGKLALALDPYPSQPFTYFMTLFDVAYCLLERGDYSEGEQLCLEGLARDGRNLDLTFTLASIYAKQERYEEAITLFQRFLKVLDRSKRNPRYNMSTLIVDSWTYEDKALSNIGQCYFRSGEIEKGVGYFEALLEKYPDKVKFYHALAMWHLKNRELEGAIAVLQRSIDRGIANGFTYFKMGEIYRERAQFDEALALYEQALRRGYDEAELYNSYGFVLYARGFYAEARAMLLKADELLPRHVGVRLNLMKVYHKLGDADRALALADQLAEIPSGDPSALKEAAEICARCADYRRGIKFYEKYLLKCSQDVEALTNLASCYAQLGFYESALLGYRAALCIDPNYQAAIDNRELLEKMTADK